MEILASLVSPILLVFVVTSMLAVGLNLKVKQILASISVRLIIVLVVVNFIIAPLIVIILNSIIGFDDNIRIGLILVASAAGAPFLPKLVQNAKGDLPTAISAMVILMILTIFYLPLALPLLIGGMAEVNSVKIAINLIITMLVPLSLGLFIHAKANNFALKAQPIFAKISNIALYVGLFFGLIAYFEELLAIFGTGGIAGAVILILLLLIIGYFAGTIVKPKAPEINKVIGLGAAQRNMAAALVVVAGFPDSLSYILVLSILSIILLILISKFLGKENKKAIAN